ncbi:MAG: DNA mismatch repair protein MutL, partial [Thermoguttaceae bacterium]|nr:DNA mismatch repair protein MutL [Thermoguttaceae bacterium]
PPAEVIQIHQKYLVFQTETGMALVDQHALHERILYEKLKRKLSAGALDAQRLLVPEMVELSAVETALALENSDLFETFGVLIESFGGRTISISSYPAILEKLGPRDIFLTLLAVLAQKGKEIERADLLEEMMHQSACKAAVKGGDFIDREQIAELLKLAREEARTDHCPHGRPTTLLFSLQELDRLFKRT